MNNVIDIKPYLNGTKARVEAPKRGKVAAQVSASNVVEQKVTKMIDDLNQLLNIYETKILGQGR